MSAPSGLGGVGEEGGRGCPCRSALSVPTAGNVHSGILYLSAVARGMPV